MDDENNINNNIDKKESINTNLDEKIVNSETDRLKKENEINESPQDFIINIEQEINEEIKIEEKNNEEKEEEIEEEDNIDHDNNVKIEKKTINITKVKAEDILKETQLEESENLDLLKIELNYLV